MKRGASKFLSTKAPLPASPSFSKTSRLRVPACSASPGGVCMRGRTYGCAQTKSGCAQTNRRGRLPESDSEGASGFSRSESRAPLVSGPSVISPGGPGNEHAPSSR